MQHLALRTDDELHSIAALRGRGVDFLTLPDAYYEQVWSRVNKMLTPARPPRPSGKTTRRSSSWASSSTPMTRATSSSSSPSPLQDRPTLFFEIICRRGSQAFGKGNFKALFEALELEQERRGNL